jgi:hypothetical protein
LKPLSDTQASFADALRDPALPAPYGVRRPAGRTGTRRFDVYRNNVAVSLTEALEDAYPAVRKLVGDDFFKAAARVFIDAEPPRSPVLLLYGRGFGDFLDGFEPAGSVPYLGDVARLEWARRAAYHAEDAPTLAIDALAPFGEDTVSTLRFTFHPAFSMIASRWPVVSLWSASTDPLTEARVDMAKGEDALVARPDLAVDTRVAPPGAAGFIAPLVAGETLGEAARAASEADAGFDLAGHLAGLFSIGAVSAVSPSVSS